MINFPCSKCGECCRNIDHIIELKEFDNGHGSCVHLMADNSCAIYEVRPDICRIEVVYDKYFSKLYAEQDFINLNVEACNKLKQNTISTEIFVITKNKGSG